MTEAQEIGLEASKSIPCPLCNHDHYCYLIQDDQEVIVKVVCQWTETPPDGWDRISTAKDGRGFFIRHGYRQRTKRKHYPDYVSLNPRPIPSDIPEWCDADDSDRTITAKTLVLWQHSIYEVHKTRGAKLGGKHQILVSLKSPGSLAVAQMEVPESELAIATHDPKTGDKERVIEYLYPSIDGTPLGKVVRRQWSDRRRVYEDFRKTKQIRPYYWLGRAEEGFWSQGQGDREWPLYREAEAKEEIIRGGIVFAVAGEQAVEAYRSLGLVATSCQGGEANFKTIVDRLKDAFKSAKEDGMQPVFVIHPDHDITGENKFSELLRECSFEKIPAVLIEPLDLWGDTPIGGDIYNLIYQSGLSTDTILRSLETAIDEAIDRQENEIYAQQQRERWQAPEVYRGELGYWREDKETGRRYFRPQGDFNFQVERELISEDGGGLVLQVKRTDDTSQCRVYLKSSDYSSVQKFTDALKRSLGGGIVCNLTNNGLQALIRVRLHEYRVTRRGKAYRLIDRIGQQPDGTWVFERCQFTRSGEPTSEDKSLWVWNPEITGNNTHFKPPAIAPRNPTALPRLVETMQRAFGSNFPLAQLALGYAAAACHYQEIQAREGGFPILNLYGDPGSGKTAAAKCALALVGQHDEGMMCEISVSAAYQRLKLAGGLLHCLDDPKRDENLDEFLKAFYNGQPRVVRGKDNEGFNTQRPHSPMMVTSNHACGESSAATQSRLARLFFPKVRDGSEEAFNEIDFGDIRHQASGCFTQLIQIGYPVSEIRELEMEVGRHLPNAHSRIAKSFALILCYAMKVAELAGVDPAPLKDYVINVICPQVNDPDESGDSLRDFFEKVFSLQSESKVGEWNCRWIEKRGESRVLAIYLPGVWTALDKNFSVSYNRKIIECLILNRGIRKTRQRFHADEDQSRAYNRAKLLASQEGVNLPETVTRFCYELPEELLKEYSAKSEGTSCRSTRSTEDFEDAETLDETGLPLLISDDQQRSTEINSLSPTSMLESPVDLFTPPVDHLLIDQINSPNPEPANVTTPSEAPVDLVDQKNAKGRASWSNEKNELQATHTHLSTPPPEEGDIVLIDAVASWIRTGSDKLPYQEVPKRYRSELEIPLNVLSDRLMLELTNPSKVLKISTDGTRARVRNQQTGRTSVFLIQFIHVLEKGGGENANGA